MMGLDILAFCRIAVGLLFLISSGSKLLSVSQFQQAIAHFRLLPAFMVPIVSLMVIVGEVAVVLLLVIGGQLLLIGFLLAIILLLIFCAALISILARSIQTSCNCFGTSEKPITRADIYRNTAFILCALIGSVLVIQGVHVEQLEPMMWLLSGAIAVVAVIATLSLDEIVQLFR